MEAAIPDPPGLEVVQPEVYQNAAGSAPGPYQDGNGKSKNELVHVANGPGFTSDDVHRLRRRIFWLTAVIIVLVVLAIILGAVLGTRHRGGNPVESPSATAVSSPSATPTSIRQKSGLAVTGWRNGSEFSIRLFYQGQDSYLRISQFESTTGNWSNPKSFVMGKAGTPIAASSYNGNSFWGGGPSFFQVDFFYLDDSDLIREWDFVDSDTIGGNGSMSNYNFSVGNTSRMASYWPSLVFQDGSGMVQEILYNSSISGNQGGWSQRSLGVLGWNSSGLAEVPLSANFTTYGIDLLYQRDDQKLIDFARNSSVGGWSTGSLSELIPPGASIGAFAVPRPQDTQNEVNTYILWQDTSGSIQVSWQDDESGWKGPATFAALDGADNGTAITCLTPSAWPASQLQATWDMSRCYFQTNGSLREVLYNGSNWIEIGNVPLS